MIERRKSDRRTLEQYVEHDRRLCERREQLVEEAMKFQAPSKIHCINQFRDKQVHTRGLNLGAIHLGGQVVV